MRNSLLRHMAKILALFVFLLLTSTVNAQYVQGGSVNASPDTIYSVTGSWNEGGPVYSYTFTKPPVAPCTLMVSIRQPGEIISDNTAQFLYSRW